MSSIRLLTIVALLAVAATASASTVVYDVDAAYRQEVFEALAHLLDRNDNRGGRVQLLPNGQIVVDTATDERQAEVAAILEAIASAEPEPTPVVSLRYWVLEGIPGGDNVGNVPSVLNDVIRELETVHGELGVRVLNSAIVSGRAGEQSVFGTDTMELVQTVYINGDQLNGQIVVDTDFQELMVNVAIGRGEYLVLGSSTAGDGIVALIVNWPE